MAGNSRAHPFCPLDVGVHRGLSTDPSGLGGFKSHRFCLGSYTNWWADAQGVSAMGWADAALYNPGAWLQVSRRTN